nr:hypothetical protein [Tanacetum cinerariifolium]
MAFVSLSNNNSTNGAFNTAQIVNTVIRVSTAGTQVNTANIDNLSDAVICAFLASQPSSPQFVNEDLEQIHLEDLEKMDLKWQMAMLTIRAMVLKENRKLTINGNETIRFDKTNVECYNYHKRRYFARECRAPKSQDTKHKKDCACGNDCFNNIDNYKKGLGYENYNAVPPSYTVNFMPPKPDLSFTRLDEFDNKHVVENSEVESSQEKPKEVRKNTNALIIKE